MLLTNILPKTTYYPQTNLVFVKADPAPPNYCKKKHEYTAVIELPHNIIDIIGDGRFVVDITVNESQSDVQLLLTEPKLEFNKKWKAWNSSEAHCVAKGGHLVSSPSPFHWYRLQSFVGKKQYWIGGTDKKGE